MEFGDHAVVDPCRVMLPGGVASAAEGSDGVGGDEAIAGDVQGAAVDGNGACGSAEGGAAGRDDLPAVDPE